jgi:hypothetical protein
METAAVMPAALDNEQPPTPTPAVQRAYIDTDDRLRKLRNAAQKKRLVEAYEAYLSGRGDDAFFNSVIDYAKRRMYHLEREFATVGTALTVDDFAQEVAIAICRQLDRFRGDSATFPSWLNGIISRKEADFFKDCLTPRRTRSASLFLRLRLLKILVGLKRSLSRLTTPRFTSLRSATSSFRYQRTCRELTVNLSIS